MEESREYPGQPIVGVGGVLIHQGRALLIRRGRPPLKGQWSIPGGGLQVGETIAEGIRRELKEETGMEVEVLDRLGVFERVMRDPSGRVQYHYVLIDHLCELKGGTLRAGGDASDAMWVLEEELGKFSLTDTAERVIRSAFRVVGAGSAERVAKNNLAGQSG